MDSLRFLSHDKTIPTIRLVAADSARGRARSGTRGDINSNGITYEIADAVIFVNYYIYGLAAFGSHVEESMAAGDINADSVTLTIADLVYLIRVIEGDADPFTKRIGSNNVALKTQSTGDGMRIEYDASVALGAIWMILEADEELNGPPALGDGASDMSLQYRIDGRQMRVIIYDIGRSAIKSGAHNLLSIPTTGTLRVVQAEAADYYGNSVNVEINPTPDVYWLSQNYPNPFNSSTRINLHVPPSSLWSINIYNIIGQLVKCYSGYSDAGATEIFWDGDDMQGKPVASGIYYYQAMAGDFICSKSMILTK